MPAIPGLRLTASIPVRLYSLDMIAAQPAADRPGAHVEPVTFSNADGHTLFGMLHVPTERPWRDVAIILLSPGVKMRVAPHRMYVKHARRLAAQGYVVLRIDFYGLGDSEGTLPEDLLLDLYGQVQIGRYVGDTRAAVDWLCRTHGFSRVVLAGLCGGALTGVLEGQDDPRVTGLLGLGLPVMLQGAGLDYRKYLTAGQAEFMRTGYLKKLRSPRAWLRLLTFRSDFRLLANTFRRARKAAPPPAAATASSPAAAAAPAEGNNANPLFPKAFERLLQRHCRILLVFGGADRLFWEWEEKYAGSRREFLSAQPHLALEVLPDANHIISFSEWQERYFDLSCRWMAEQFPGRRDPAPSRSAEPRVAHAAEIG
jgi:uncharacterized protein